MGGAREARCGEKGSLNTKCRGSEEYQATLSRTGLRFSRAAASAGMCSAWHTWQAVSGPWLCS
jgi:hypothetical protein